MTATEKQSAEPVTLADGTWIYAVPNTDRVYVTEAGDVYAGNPHTEELERLKQYTEGRRYAAVWIRGAGITNVHKIMCRTFHGEPPTARHVVARNDGDPTNNRPENLRWDTRWNAGKTAFEKRNPPTERQTKLAASTPPKERKPQTTRPRPWETAMREYQSALAERGMADPLHGPQPKSTDFDDE